MTPVVLPDITCGDGAGGVTACPAGATVADLSVETFEGTLSFLASLFAIFEPVMSGFAVGTALIGGWNGVAYMLATVGLTLGGLFGTVLVGAFR